MLASRSRRTDRGSGLRWFAAEFLVVVTGVLVALALGAWWQEREERGREAEYLQQLLADLQRTEETLRRTSEWHWHAAQAARRVTDAFWAPPDELNREMLGDMMFPRRSTRQRPIMGTIEALISTGDLRLIRSDRLRADLVAYVEFAESRIENIQRHDETYYRPGQNALRTKLDYGALEWMMDEGRADRESPPPFPIELDAVFSDHDIFAAFGNLGVAHRNQAWNYGNILDRARHLQAIVHRELNGVFDAGNCQLELDPVQSLFFGACGDPVDPGGAFSIELSEAVTDEGWERCFSGARIDRAGERIPVRLCIDELGNGQLRDAGGDTPMRGSLDLLGDDIDRIGFRLTDTEPEPAREPWQ